MKKFFFLASLANASLIFGQCPTADVNLTSQADVNAFPTTYSGCLVIPDGIAVEISGNDIVDLTPLGQLTGALGPFEVRDCPDLESLDGLNQISFFGNDVLDGFILRDLPSLTDVTALINVDSISGEFTIRTCGALINLNGFDSLRYVNGSVIIRDNAMLESLEGFDSLQFIGETLEIVENPLLNNLSALSSVDTIVGGIEGGVFIEDNASLTSLNGLGHAQTVITGNLDILINGNLSVCSVPSICAYLANPPVGAVITINLNTTGCNSEVEILEGCGQLSLQDYSNSMEEIYPNPFTRELTISMDKSGIVLLTDPVGRSRQIELQAGVNELNLSDLESGVYFLIFSDGRTFSIVKE